MREYRDMRLSALATLKLEAGCLDCGYRDHPEALEFDHVRGLKHSKLSDMMLAPLVALLDEVDKCDVRCANCHRVKTAERREPSTPRSLALER